MTDAPIIAERPILLESEDGARTAVILRIRAPERTTDSRWACSVGLCGLAEDEVVARGVDAWQALTLGLGVLRTALRELCADGTRIRWVDGSGDLSIDELFEG